MIEYQVTSVTRMTPPNISKAENWHQYTIQGNSRTITGYRNAKLEEVKGYAESCVIRLNSSFQTKSPRR